jgi:hypothetical protein
LERKSQEYLKEVESAKFHEERGKIDCNCGSCEEERKIRAEVKKERKLLMITKKSKRQVKNNVRNVKSESKNWMRKVEFVKVVRERV